MIIENSANYQLGKTYAKLRIIWVSTKDKDAISKKKVWSSEHCWSRRQEVFHLWDLNYGKRFRGRRPRTLIDKLINDPGIPKEGVVKAVADRNHLHNSSEVVVWSWSARYIECTLLSKCSRLFDILARTCILNSPQKCSIWFRLVFWRSKKHLLINN